MKAHIHTHAKYFKHLHIDVSYIFIADKGQVYLRFVWWKIFIFLFPLKTLSVLSQRVQNAVCNPTQVYHIYFPNDNEDKVLRDFFQHELAIHFTFSFEIRRFFSSIFANTQHLPPSKKKRHFSSFYTNEHIHKLRIYFPPFIAGRN